MKMRRGLVIVGLSIALYTVTLIGGSYAICHANDVMDVVGDWATQAHTARVRIERCVNAPQTLCGTITWLWEPVDEHGEAMRDTRNPDPKLRSRPIVGLSLLEAFRETQNALWSGGRIYNPENGRQYDATLRLRNPEILEVKGCVLFLCQTQLWRRMEALCRQPSDL